MDKKTQNYSKNEFNLFPKRKNVYHNNYTYHIEFVCKKINNHSFIETTKQFSTVHNKN